MHSGRAAAYIIPQADLLVAVIPQIELLNNPTHVVHALSEILAINAVLRAIAEMPENDRNHVCGPMIASTIGKLNSLSAYLATAADQVGRPTPVRWWERIVRGR